MASLWAGGGRSWAIVTHTLIVLCKHAHRDLTKPWRKGLIDFVEADLMDKTRDGTRATKERSRQP